MSETMKRWAIVGGAALAALLLSIAILLAVVVKQNADAANQDRYDRARETCEAQLGPMTEDNLEAYAECAARLLP